MRKGTNTFGGGERYHPKLRVDLIRSQENQPKALQAIVYPEQLVRHTDTRTPYHLSRSLALNMHIGDSAEDMFGCTTQLPKIANGTSHLHNGVACAR